MSTVENPSPATPSALRAKLAIMMFLQYFVQGCYMPIISVYLKESLRFEAEWIGYVGSALAVGPLFAPFIIGQLVDRKYATQRVLAVCHLLGGIVMLLLYTQKTYWPVMILGTVYSIVYIPTMMLTNSLSFHHLVDGKSEFPLVRLWGTVGFIAPAWLLEFVLLRDLEGEQLDLARGIALAAAGLAGIVMSIYSVTMLPDTPPAKDAREKARFAPAAAIALMKRRDVFVLVLISFFAAIVHKFHFVANGPFLTSLLRAGGEQGAWEASISSLGQIAEIGVMAILAWIIARLGFRGAITLGLFAYAGRCLLFVAADQWSENFQLAMTLACVGQLFHGLCFSCFMAASFMFFDRTTPAHIRGTVQNLYGTFVLSAGFFAGGIVTGKVMAYYKTYVGDVEVIDFTGVWSFAAIWAFVCAVAFYLLFPAYEPIEAAQGASDPSNDLSTDSKATQGASS